MLSTKEELYLYLEKISRGYALKDLKYFTANHISESLNISRNLASQYLNELVKEERAIKVNSRPVYFFHKKNVEREAQVALETCVFSGMDDFQRKCRSDENKRDFQKAIGYYLSLSSCIEQCKAAVKYPPNGLPALFNGAGGTGKAFLSRLMYEYAVNERVIGTAGAASLPPYITVDCSEYAQNEEKFAISLCGSEDGKGWLAKANGGILFFDEIDRLPFSGQELIYSYLISGQYKGYHDDEHVFESNARLVFSTTKVPAETLYKPLARMIPIVIPVPTLHERTADEKEEMLVSFLKAEGRRMGVDVSISQNAFHCMLEFSYENNIDELKTCVTSSCAGAYLEKTSDGIAIHSYHLPEYMLSSLKLEVEDKDKRMIHLNSYSRDTSLGQTVQYFQIMLDVFEDYRQDMLSFDGLMMEFRKQLNDYYDYLIYGQKLVNIKISTYEQLINQIFENVGEMYGISLSKKYSHLLARRLYIQLQGDHLIDNWMKQNHNEIEEMFQAVSAVLEKESVICSRIVNLIKLNLDIEADSLNQLFLLLDIKNQNQKLEDILKRASESNVCTYRIIHNVQKEDAVIFSGENGIDTTEKLKELILKTSATSIPVKFVAYDYYRLMKNGSHDEIFQQYHVKCIIGLFNPEIEGIPFISLEDIISMNSAEKLTNIFSEYLDEEQMEIFNQNLVKNFSLQNVVESITILNPDKLLDEVEQAVGRLQKITGRKIAGRIMIGLYVHLCCLVERLVTKTPIDNYQDLEEFEQKHADFIRQVRDSFQDISRHYRVALPVSEIAYIYDYMHLNSKNKLSGQAESPAVREDE